MITIKLPYKTEFNNIQKLQQQYSNVVRFAYNRFLENKKQIEVRSLQKFK